MFVRMNKKFRLIMMVWSGFFAVVAVNVWRHDDSEYWSGAGAGMAFMCAGAFLLFYFCCGERKKKVVEPEKPKKRIVPVSAEVEAMLEAEGF